MRTADEAMKFFHTQQKAKELARFFNQESILGLINFGKEAQGEIKRIIQTNTAYEYGTNIPSLNHTYMAIEYNLNQLRDALSGVTRYQLVKVINKETAFVLN